MTITEFIKHHFDKSGITWAVFAEKIETTQADINRIFKGQIPSAQKFFRICKALNVPESDLIKLYKTFSCALS